MMPYKNNREKNGKEEEGERKKKITDIWPSFF